jgi:Uma2 family endonuclease
MIESNVFPADERFELLEGILTEMSPQSMSHSYVVGALNRYLSRQATEEELVLVQQPIYANGISLPEPDLAVVPPGSHNRRRPRASESLLIVEVSLSSVTKDRRKSKVYAQAGAPEYWLVNVTTRQAEVHTEPSANGYRLVRFLEEDDEIAPAFNPSAKIRLADLLPPPDFEDAD